MANKHDQDPPLGFFTSTGQNTHEVTMTRERLIGLFNTIDGVHIPDDDRLSDVYIEQDEHDLWRVEFVIQQTTTSVGTDPRFIEEDL